MPSTDHPRFIEDELKQENAVFTTKWQFRLKLFDTNLGNSVKNVDKHFSFDDKQQTAESAADEIIRTAAKTL